MAATWKSLIVFGILGTGLLLMPWGKSGFALIGVPADPCPMHDSFEAEAGSPGSFLSLRKNGCVCPGTVRVVIYKYEDPTCVTGIIAL